MPNPAYAGRPFMSMPSVHSDDLPGDITKIIHDDLTFGMTVVVNGETVAFPKTMSGQPLSILWSGAGDLIGFTYGMGHPLDESQAKWAMTAIREGRVLPHEEAILAFGRTLGGLVPRLSEIARNPLDKIETDDVRGYMTQWRTRAGNVRTKIDYEQLMFQLTGLREWIFRDAGEDLPDVGVDASFASCRPVLLNGAGVVAAFREVPGGLEVEIATVTGAVIRTIDVEPTIASLKAVA